MRIDTKKIGSHETVLRLNTVHDLGVFVLAREGARGIANIEIGHFGGTISGNGKVERRSSSNGTAGLS